MPIEVEIVSQERLLMSIPDADIVIIPGSEGVMGVLQNHAPLISTLNFGELIVRRGEAEEIFAIYGGVVEVRPTKVVVLADSADFAADINLKEAEEARARVLELLKEGVPEEDETLIASQLRRADLAINLARKTRSQAGQVRIQVVKDDIKKE